MLPLWGAHWEQNCSQMMTKSKREDCTARNVVPVIWGGDRNWLMMEIELQNHAELPFHYLPWFCFGFVFVSLLLWGVLLCFVFLFLFPQFEVVTG